MLASRLNSILPPLDKKEALSSAMIASIKGESGIAESFYKRSFSPSTSYFLWSVFDWWW